MIAWEKLTKPDIETILNIVSRYAVHRPDLSYLHTTMDIEACHIYAPLNLTGLLQAKDSDFFHDVCGIIRHIDRETGKLKNGFSPRYSKDQ